MWRSVGLTLLVVGATVACALVFMLLGWYVVWHLFLSKFKFLRELVGDAGTPQTERQPDLRGERPRGRSRSARQRVACPDST